MSSCSESILLGAGTLLTPGPLWVSLPATSSSIDFANPWSPGPRGQPRSIQGDGEGRDLLPFPRPSLPFFRVYTGASLPWDTAFPITSENTTAWVWGRISLAEKFYRICFSEVPYHKVTKSSNGLSSMESSVTPRYFDFWQAGLSCLTYVDTVFLPCSLGNHALLCCF